MKQLLDDWIGTIFSFAFYEVLKKNAQKFIKL